MAPYSNTRKSSSLYTFGVHPILHPGVSRLMNIVSKGGGTYTDVQSRPISAWTNPLASHSFISESGTPRNNT